MNHRLHRVVQDPRFVFSVACLVTFLLFVGHLASYDLWWHLKAGQMILQTGTMPRTDPFSFTAAGRPWVYHSWLAGIILFLIHQAAGTGGLILFQAVFLTCSVMLAWAAALRRKAGAGLAAVLALTVAFQMQSLALTRPFLFSFILFVVFYLVLQDAFERPLPASSASTWGAVKWFLWGRGGRLIVLPPLTVLWANLHAAVVVALLMITAFGAAELVRVAIQEGRAPRPSALFARAPGARFRALLLTAVLCLLASCVTPYGPGSVLYAVWLFKEVKLVKQVQEWQPMPLRVEFAVFWLLLAFGALVLARSAFLCSRAGRLRERAGQFCADILLLGGFAVMALSAVRNLAWFVLLAPPALGYHLAIEKDLAPADDSQGAGGARRERFYVGAACLLALVLAVRQVCWVPGFGLGVSEERLPVRACDYLERAPLRGKLYNIYEWGGYLIWRSWPGRKVFIDGRCDVYGDRVIGEALAVAQGRGDWEEILRRYGVEGLLIRYRTRDSRHFFRSGRWHCVYWDDTALVAVSDAVRRSSPPGVEYFELSNPAVFEERLKDSPPERILGEIDRVLARQPGCWTAWAERARCLLKMAQEQKEGQSPRLQEALAAARRAAQINDRQPEPWRALAQCYEAMGRSEDAAKAQHRARSLAE